MKGVLYTIGHSNHPAEKVVELLREHGVTSVADVRSLPYSRMNPQFNREAFCSQLKDAGIVYVFLGRELGARSEDRGCYVEGKVQYERLAQTPLFRSGLERVTQDMKSHTVALLCAEKDPLTCHRTILVSRHLVAQGVKVAHILEDGRLERHEEAVSRLLRELGFFGQDLFITREQLVEHAYERRARQIAYTESGPSEEQKVAR